MLSIAILLVLVGGWAGVSWLLGAGATVVTIIVTVHCVYLVRWSRSPLAGRFAYLARFYAVSSAALMVAGVLGGLMGAGVGGDWYSRLWLAHVHLTLLGWVGLAVVGTVFTLWPTVLATRLPEGTVGFARRSLWLLAAGLGVAAGGLLLGWQPVAAVGVLGYVAGLGAAGFPLVRAARRGVPGTGAVWMLVAGVGWLVVAALADLVLLVAAPSPQVVVARVTAALPVLVVGVVAQVLIGALSYLLPVILSRGPAERRGLARRLDRGWLPRLVALNVAVPLIGLDLPGYATTAGWWLAAAGVGAFAGLALPAVLPVVVRGGLPPERRTDHSGRWAPVAGLLVGTAAVVAAVLVATSGPAPGTEAPPVAGGVVRAVDITLAHLRIVPNTVDVTPGARVVLRVSNQDSMTHDLRADGGARTPMLRRGQAAELDLGIVAGDTSAWCTVPGHRAAGMVLRIRVTGQAPAPSSPEPAETLDLGRHPSAGWSPRDARLAPASGQRVHRIELHVIEGDVEVAPGTKQRMWTFGGTVPGPCV